MPLSKALSLINGKGMILVPAKQGSEQQSMKDLVTGFLSPDTNRIQKDQLFTLPRNKTEGTITKEDKYFIYLSDGTKVDKKTLVAIIYRNGQSMIYGPTDQAAVLFGTFQQESIQSPPPTPSLTPPPGTTTPTPDTPAAPQQPTANSPKALHFPPPAPN